MYWLLKTASYYTLVAILILAVLIVICVGLILGWFRKCSECGSRLTTTGTYEENTPDEETEIHSYRHCFSCGSEKELPPPKLSRRSGH